MLYTCYLPNQPEPYVVGYCFLNDIAIQMINFGLLNQWEAYLVESVLVCL